MCSTPDVIYLDRARISNSYHSNESLSMVRHRDKGFLEDSCRYMDKGIDQILE